MKSRYLFQEDTYCQPVDSAPNQLTASERERFDSTAEQLRFELELDAKMVKATHDKICLEQELELERLHSEEQVRRRKIQSSVINNHEPQIEDDSCPICFEEFLPSSNESYLLCCGKKTCQKCYLKVNNRANCHHATSLEIDIANKCIFCKTNHPTSGMQEKKALEKHIKRNRSWAIYLKGAHFRDGDSVYGFHPQEAFQHFLSAAEMGHELSQTEVALCYNNGFGIKKSLSRAVKWYRLAIDKGNTRAQQLLGELYLTEDTLGNEAEGLRLLKLAAAGNSPVHAACSSLLSYNFGRICNSEGIIDHKRLHLSIFWAEKLAMQGCSEGYYALACIIHNATETAWHPYSHCIPEYDPIPTISFLIQKAISICTKEYALCIEQGMNEKRKCIENELNNAYRFQEQEINSRINACPCGKNKRGCVLKVCSKCNTVKYCGRQCQVQHWRNGHKAACQNHWVRSLLRPELFQ